MKTLRASAAPIWANCPGSTALSKIERPDTEASREGSLLHLMTLRHLLDPRDYKITLADWQADFTDLDTFGIVVTEEHLKLAYGAYQYCRSLQNSTNQTEQHVKGYSLPEGVEGTFDYCGYSEESKTLHVLDYKFGFSPVSPINNWQLLIYSIGAVDTYTKYVTGVPAVYSVKSQGLPAESNSTWGELCFSAVFKLSS